MKRIAVVTGANRGLGFETCRQLVLKDYQVILTSRSEENASKAQALLAKEGLKVIPFALDVSQKSHITKLKDFLTKEFGRLDVLVNNAGIFPDNRNGGSVLETDADTLRMGMETNLYGPFQISQALIPLMLKNKYGRIVNLSSGMGQLSEMNSGFPAYRISKTALNAMTRIFHDEFHEQNILVNSVCPGWVKTDMGGPDADLEIKDGVDTIVWLATLPDGAPSGGFFRNRKQIPW